MRDSPVDKYGCAATGVAVTLMSRTILAIRSVCWKAGYFSRLKEGCKLNSTVCSSESWPDGILRSLRTLQGLPYHVDKSLYNEIYHTASFVREYGRIENFALPLAVIALLSSGTVLEHLDTYPKVKE